MAPCFQAIASVVDLARKANKVKQVKAQQNLHLAFIHWIDTYHEMQVVKQVRRQYEKWLRYRALQGLKAFLHQRRQQETHEASLG